MNVKPHAALLIWNYAERLGTTRGVKKEEQLRATEKQGIHDKRKIVSTLSLISIETAKSKSSPMGRFTCKLAPTKNWVSTLTTGSWIAILMSNSELSREDIYGAKASKMVKFLGRIESVVANVEVNSDTGARQTSYVVTGVDWGWVFNTKFYNDPLVVANRDSNNIQVSDHLRYFDILPKGGSTQTISYETTDLLKTLLKSFGTAQRGEEALESTLGKILRTDYKITMPDDLIEYMGFVDNTGKSLNNIGVIDNLVTNTGVLKSGATGKYKEVKTSYGYVNTHTMVGIHSVWQTLIEHSNPALNEMFCDLEFENDKPKLTFTNRIKPFILSKDKTVDRVASGQSSSTDLIKPLISKYSDIKRYNIPLESIVSFTAGISWRDRVNFVEVRPRFAGASLNFVDLVTKQKNQLADEDSFERDGLRPVIMNTTQWPVSSSGDGLKADMEMIAAWKELAKDWYFDLHKMLHGKITFIGQDFHIPVGANIMIPAMVMGDTRNFNKAHASVKKEDAFIMAHVEEVSNVFRVNPQGGRSYMTSITFVRGVLANKSGDFIGDGLLDDNSETTTPAGDRNEHVTGHSTKQDPDSRNRLK